MCGKEYVNQLRLASFELAAKRVVIIDYVWVFIFYMAFLCSLFSGGAAFYYFLA